MLSFKENYNIAIWDRIDGEELQIPPSHGTIANSPYHVWDGFFCPFCYEKGKFNWIDFDTSNEDEEEMAFLSNNQHGKLIECPEHGYVDYHDPAVRRLIQGVEKDIKKRRR